MSAPELWADMVSVDGACRVSIRLLFMDVDGTLTDGRVYVGEGGELFKAFDIKDGLGIRNVLPSMGVVPVIITGRRSAMLERRCAELGIGELHQGVSDKLPLLREITESYGVGLGCCAYIGDDVNDLPCMEVVKGAGGVVGCPSDAVPEIHLLADFVSTRDGGRGAVREFITWLRDA